MPNIWCIPSGHIEPGETKKAAAMRELFEETGLKVAESQLIELADEMDSTESIGDSLELPLKATIYAVILPDKRLEHVILGAGHSEKRLIGLNVFGELGRTLNLFTEFTKTDRAIASQLSPRLEQISRVIELQRGTQTSSVLQPLKNPA